jgi:hypothetical protein
MKSVIWVFLFSQLVLSCSPKSVNTVMELLPFVAANDTKIPDDARKPQASSGSSSQTISPFDPATAGTGTYILPQATVNSSSSTSTLNIEYRADLLFNPSAVNKYQSLKVRFTHYTNTETVKSGFDPVTNPIPPLTDTLSILKPDGTPIKVSLSWDSPQDLMIDPAKELDPNTTYTLKITSGVKSVKGDSLKPLSATFVTEEPFFMKHKVNSLPIRTVNGTATFASSSTTIVVPSSTAAELVVGMVVSGKNIAEGSQISSISSNTVTLSKATGGAGTNFDVTFTTPGLSLDKTTNPTVTLESTINNHSQIKSLKLCKMGFTDPTIAPGSVICKKDFAIGFELCSGGCTAETFSNNITQYTEIGGNLFFYLIESYSGKKYYKLVNFNYGTAANISVLSKTANTTSGSKTITVTDASGLSKGMFITGSSVPFGSVITGLAGNDITISQAATATVSGATLTATDSSLREIAKVFLDGQAIGDNIHKSAMYSLGRLISSYGKGEFTLNTKDLNAKISESTSNTRTPTDAYGNPCLAWEKKANTNPTGDDFSIRYLTKVGPFCNIEVSGDIFSSTAYSSVRYTATADVYITEVNIPQTALATNAIQTTGSMTQGSKTITVTDPTGIVAGMVLQGTNLTVESVSGNTVTVNNAASVTLTEKPLDFETSNISASLSPLDGNLDIYLYGRKAQGKMSLVAKVKEIEFFDYLVDDTFVFNGTSGKDKDGNTIVADGDDIFFALNNNPPNVIAHLSGARVNLSSNGDGNMVIGLLNNGMFDFANLTDITKTNPVTKEWSDNIYTLPVTGTGAIAAVIADVVNKKIDEVKPKVVQYVVRDIAVNVAPEIVNSILSGLRGGMKLTFPDYLPPPLNKIELTLSAKVSTDMTSKQSGSNAGIEASASVGTALCIRDASNRCYTDAGYSNPTPPIPLGTDSYIQTKSGAMPSFLDRSSGNPGLLLGLHPDIVNQIFYQLWRSGGINLKINETFINSINGFAGTSTLLKLTTSLLKAEPILSVFSPGKTVVSTQGEPIYLNDAIELRTNPLVLPVVKIAALSGIAGNTEVPKVEITLPDLEISIIGKRTDIQRQADGKTYFATADADTEGYLVGKVRITLKTKAELGFGTYSLPPSTPAGFTPSPDLLATVGNTSIQLKISAQEGDLYYLVEPLEGAGNNPLGLDPDGIWEVMEPLVRSLVVPLLNNVTKDIPLPKLEKCGIRLYDLKNLSIPSNTLNSYLLLNSGMSNYTFTGDCTF